MERLETYACWAHGAWWPDVYGFLQLWEEDWKEGLCDDCAVQLKTAFDAERAEFWRMLPSLCGMKEWDKLVDTSATDN